MARMGGFWNERTADLLKRTLEDRGLGVEELAGRLSVDARTVRYWMRTDRPPTAPSIENLAQLCKQLDVAVDYFRQAANVAPEVTDAIPEPSAELLPPADQLRDTPRRWRVFFSILAAVTIAAAIVIWTLPPRVSARKILAIPAEEPGVYDRAIEGDVSPDGKWTVFQARSLPSEVRMLFVRPTEGRKARPLPITAGDYTSFFWSNDSRSIFFIKEADLMKVSVSGGTPERVAYVGEALKGTANADDVVVLGSRKGLLRVFPTGKSEFLTRLREHEVAHSQPFFLPDEERVLFTIAKKAPSESLSRFAAIASLRTGAIDLVGPLASRAQYIDGHLLYVREQILFARPFDLDTLRFTGEERRLAFPVWTDRQTGEAAFSASSSTLLVMPPQEVPPLYYISANGATRRKISDLPGIQYVAVAKQSDQIAVAARHKDRDVVDLWLQPLDGRPRVRLLSQSVRPTSPVFSADDRLLYYADTATSWANIHVIELQPGGTPPRPILQLSDMVAPRDVSPNGHFLLFQRWHNRDGSIWYMPVDDPSKARPFMATPEDEGDGRFSPDGKRVSFVASRGGVYSVYVADFPPTSQLAAPAAQGHGWKARWSADGRRIYFARDRSVLEADPTTRVTRKVFDMPRAVGILEVARDGGFFVREMPVYRPQMLITPWRGLMERPLNLAPKQRSR